MTYVQWVTKDPSFLQAASEDADQTAQTHRLILVFAGRTCYFVGFVMMRLILNLQSGAKENNFPLRRKYSLERYKILYIYSLFQYHH